MVGARCPATTSDPFSRGSVVLANPDDPEMLMELERLPAGRANGARMTARSWEIELKFGRSRAFAAPVDCSRLRLQEWTRPMCWVLRRGFPDVLDALDEVRREGTPLLEEHHEDSTVLVVDEWAAGGLLGQWSYRAWQLGWEAAERGDWTTARRHALLAWRTDAYPRELSDAASSRVALMTLTLWHTEPRRAAGDAFLAAEVSRRQEEVARRIHGMVEMAAARLGRRSCVEPAGEDGVSQ